MRIKIPVYQPALHGNEEKYILECLRTNWISSKGSFINEFERKFAEYIQVNYATTTANGTVALHLALLALNIQPGDEIIVPTFTYVASVNAIAYMQATPVFVDSEKRYWQIDSTDVLKKITPKTKAIMVVHLYGHSCDMDALKQIALDKGLYLIEDCAEATGTLFNGKHVGTFGDIGAFSFYGNKTITTGEGGMVVTNNVKIFDRLQHLKAQGLARGREYWHDIIGYNYRMTNLCAAIGLAQLEQIDVILKKKRQLAQWYRVELEGLPLGVHEECCGVRHSYWMISILLDNAEHRDALRAVLTQEGIETRPLFYPVHTMPIYEKISCDIKLPIAEDLSSRGFNLPSWPDLSQAQVAFICSHIKNYFSSSLQYKTINNKTVCTRV
jgi:perosamine synthetase